ncbi:ATP-binding protein [Candidatus Albibeggiatoa sp. nov. NOAA]|uniref:ATP-binding protein n=1 Tax=Candidatus Albibeggiatoa sp. nov. NOAA TaxID=3162724 RepID=UPI0032F6C83A|nr:ATP-binding protein [Thiotrichaceae bacterium]
MNIIAWLGETWVNSVIGIVGIVIGIASLGNFDIAIIVGVILFIILLLRSFISPKKVIKPSVPDVQLPDHFENIPQINNFKYQLGNPEIQIVQNTCIPNKNPFVDGKALCPNSPVFFGRDNELRKIQSTLVRADNAGSVSIVGENKSGKSSLLFQIYQWLGAQYQTISIHTTMSDWQFSKQPDFFVHLHQAICSALSLHDIEIAMDYEAFKEFVRDYAAQGYYFVLLIDEFDKMVKYPNFDNEFFGNMRSLGDNPGYHFSFVLSSRQDLETICDNNKALGSEFWNIFDTHILGLLDEKIARQSLLDFMKASLGNVRGLNAKIDEILQLSGRQPFFMQVVASEYWWAIGDKKDVKPADISYKLRPHFKALWKHCSERERKVLLLVANGKHVGENPITQELQQRGLLTEDYQLFSPLFEQFVKNKC